MAEPTPKRCPFCRGKAELCPDGDGSIMWFSCSECGAGGPAAEPGPGLVAETKQELEDLEQRALDNWNQRPADPDWRALGQALAGAQSPAEMKLAKRAWREAIERSPS